MLKTNVPWDWSEEVDQEFRNAKSRLSKGQEIHPFDVNLPTMLLKDASRLNGLGFALMQMVSPEKKANTPENTTNEDIKARWHMIKCGSVSLTDCQQPANSRRWRSSGPAKSAGTTLKVIKDSQF